MFLFLLGFFNLSQTDGAELELESDDGESCGGADGPCSSGSRRFRVVLCGGFDRVRETLTGASSDRD